MTPQQAGQRMQRMHVALDAARTPGLDSARVGGAYVTACPGHEPPYPSANPNRALMLDTESLSPEAVRDVAEHFASRGVKRYCVFLGPGARAEAVRADFLSRGLLPWKDTTYPTLVRSTRQPRAAPTELAVRVVTAAEARSLRREIGEIYKDGSIDYFTRSLGRSGFDHFLAFASPHHAERRGTREVPVSAGFLFASRELGACYLGCDATHPSFRGRGGQSAIIAARVARASELGMEWCCAETLSILETSLGNYRRAGFAVVFEAEVLMSAART